MKKIYLILFLCIFIGATPVLSQARSLLLDDFEGVISGGPEGSVTTGGERGESSVKAEAAQDIKYSGNQSLKITYKVLPNNYSNYIWVNWSSDYWLVKPEDIAWEEYSAIAFYMYGSDSKTKISFFIIDAGSEVWYYIFEDNFIGWKQIVCPFSEFKLLNWQPKDADKNAKLDFPVKSFRIEPRAENKVEKGTLYFNKVDLIAVGTATKRAKNLLLDDFEGEISGGPESSVNAGAKGESSVEVQAAQDIKYSGNQSLKITYKAVPNNSYSYLWFNRSSDYWLVKPEDIAWDEYSAIAFYMYGSDSNEKISLDITDSGFELWRYIFEDNFIGWKQIVCPFSEFHVREDWQLDNAKRNAKLDFPIRAINIELLIDPLSDGKIKEGKFYLDKLELILR